MTGLVTLIFYVCPIESSAFTELDRRLSCISVHDEFFRVFFYETLVLA